MPQQLWSSIHKHLPGQDHLPVVQYEFTASFNWAEHTSLWPLPYIVRAPDVGF